MADIKPSALSLTSFKFPLWLLRIITVFPLSGFLGADHFLLGSNLTGGAKAFLNVITLGAWYFYDICYVLSSDKVVSDGFDLPFIGGMNIGKGAVTQTLLGGMENIVGTILKILFIAILVVVAVVSNTYHSNFSGVLKSFISSLTYISGGIAIIMTLQLGYSFYTGVKGALPALPKGSLSSLPSLPGGVVAAVTGAATESKNDDDDDDEKPTNQSGGGSMIRSLSTIAQEMIDMKKSEELSYESTIFLGILAVITLGGITYAVFQYKKQPDVNKDEELGDTGGVRDTVGSPYV